jgi:hypothetical protein
MAAECEFYFYDRDYCCGLLKNSGREYVLSSDTVHKYCWGYNYNDCPYYRNKSNYTSSSSCFLTTACINGMGKSDNCEELKILRNFRDTYVKSLANGKKDIEEYYRIAPQIVHSINMSENYNTIWKDVYRDLVEPCCELIKIGEYNKAYKKYKNFILNFQLGDYA